MLNNALGYIFEGRYDVFKHIALMESYKVMNYDGNVNVFVTFAVDSLGNFITPSFMDAEGLKPLSDKITNERTEKDAVELFVKSNKPTLAPLSQIAIIVDAKFSFNAVTGEYNADNSNIRLFIPKVVKDNVGIFNQYGTSEPGIVCDEVKSVEGLNIFKVDEKIYQGYINKVLQFVREKEIKTRVSYLISRLH